MRWMILLITTLCLVAMASWSYAGPDGASKSEEGIFITATPDMMRHLIFRDTVYAYAGAGSGTENDIMYVTQHLSSYLDDYITDDKLKDVSRAWLFRCMVVEYAGSRSSEKDRILKMVKFLFGKLNGAKYSVMPTN